MQRPHIAYVGEADRWFHDNVSSVQAQANRTGAPFEHHFVAGDHASSLRPALEAFLVRALTDAQR